MTERYTADDWLIAAHEVLKRHDIAPRSCMADLVMEVMSRLTRPELAPDVVVTYEWNDLLQNPLFYRNLIHRGATNIMPHYPEDKVLEWGREIAGLLSYEVMPYLQAKMDAYKRGEG